MGGSKTEQSDKGDQRCLIECCLLKGTKDHIWGARIAAEN